MSADVLTVYCTECGKPIQVYRDRIQAGDTFMCPECKMKPDNFMNLVEKMRNAQRRYFRFRDPAVMEQSKRLEREVDDILTARRETQQKLF